MANKPHPPILIHGRTTGAVNVPVQVDASGVIQTTASFTSSGAAIQDGVTPSILATVRNFTNSKPLAVSLTDANGDAYTVSGGGGGGDASAANQTLEIAAINKLNAQILDLDSGAGTANTVGFFIAIPASGGPVAGGTTTNPVNVALPAATVTTLTPPSNTGYSTSAKQDTQITSLANLDVALSTRTKPADQQHAIVDSGTLAAVTAITNALPAGANVIGHVITDTGSTTAVTGTVTVTGGLTDTQLRATAVPVTAVLTAGSAVVGHVIADTGSTTAVTGTVTVGTHAVTIASGGVASGAIASGALASGSVSSGAVSSGAIASGAIAAGAIAAGATSIADNEDVASADGDRGVKMLAVRKATPANTSGTDGDYEFLQVSAGRLWTQTGGSVATNVAIADNPVNLGAQAVSSENAAVTTARQVQLVADLVGKLIVLPYANPENFVSGAITSAMTGTTSTSLLAAPASGLRNYITQITVSNASTTVPTDIIIQDGSGGATLYTLPCPIGTGTGTGTSGATFVFPTPLRQPTTATAIFCANVTTGSSTKVSASGYKGA